MSCLSHCFADGQFTWVSPLQVFARVATHSLQHPMAAENRLRAERKSWRQDHPFMFVAKPVTKPDGSQNLFEWDCRVRCRGTRT